ncbi:uncharacterized protein BX663DRAFT_493174 [Cokeromyces recurvatus]|uniref:uncharacterized protein n=1 Tax=Cokeromyces recurvatus TaxID=90255 RepID=UPI00221E5BD0|nr:uncharacterized protein BX663DRAFT_493174 [Cokeromyces recurvatus]KAI7908152.1 hypothetical protein BX663DRAFT_493174 [Cokeromyces recurvatus]
MNRLAFGEFHKKHFGAHQKSYWHSILQLHLQNYQSQHYDDDTYYDQQQYYSYESNKDYYDDSEHNDDQQEEYEIEEEEEEEELSKEAIEIFKFSEAYKQKLEMERLEREEKETEGMEDWQYDESTVHCSGGLEAPTTSLILTRPEASRPDRESELRMKEELLNSAYLSSCLDDEDNPVVLWPVLPFKL